MFLHLLKKCLRRISLVFGFNVYQEPVIICRYITKRKLRGYPRQNKI